MTANVMTIAGSDSGGGAGIQGDLKTFSALGVYATSVVTALTAQNTREVRAIHDVPPAFIEQQMAAVFDDIEISVVKIGMLASAPVIEAVARGLERYPVSEIVLDPVMVAKSGDHLLHADAVACLRERLIPLCTIITPNLPETATLLNMDEIIESESEMHKLVPRLLKLGSPWVLVKGGHLSGEQCVDILASEHGERTFSSPRIRTMNTHGTGCTLSSAIAAHLARGFDMSAAVQAARTFLMGAIIASDRLSVGSGHGPVHHFHDLWNDRYEESS